VEFGQDIDAAFSGKMTSASWSAAGFGMVMRHAESISFFLEKADG
jgi:hypothetical protein